MHYTDQQIIEALKAPDAVNNRLILKHFFAEVEAYALGCWRKKYSRLQEEDWKLVFSNSNLKFISRIKKGIVLKENTTLKTYYTGIVDFACLDFVSPKKKEVLGELPVNRTIEESESIIEKTERAQLIKEKLEQITGNAEQVKVLLLLAKGYSYKEIVPKTSYLSDGACRNASSKAKQKIIAYILRHPEEGVQLRNWLLGK